MTMTWKEAEAQKIDNSGNTYGDYQKAAIEGIVADTDNPIFILSSVSTDLLQKIASGDIDLVKLAKIQLAARSQELRP